MISHLNTQKQNDIDYPLRLVDVKSSTITFIGEAQAAAETSDPKWRIKRLFRNGSITEERFAQADAKGFDKIWDNRESVAYFPVPVFNYTLSTLFDGINVKINLGNVHNFDHSNQFTIVTWARPDNDSARHQLYAKTTDDGNVYGHSLAINSGGALFIQARAPSALRSHTGTATVPSGVWSQIALAFNGSSNMNGFQPYINAVADTTPASGSFSNSWLASQNFLIGCRNLSTNTFPYPGYMFSFSVWNKALAQSELDFLYNDGAPKDPRTASFVSNLVSWHPLGDGDIPGTVLDNHGSNDGTMINFNPTPFQAVVP